MDTVHKLRVYFLPFAASFLLLSSCATYHFLEPADLGLGQEIVYVDGYPAVTETYASAEDEGLIVAIYGYTTSQHLVLELYYGNATQSYINVFPDEIIVEGLGTDSSVDLTVWEANEYIRRVQRRQNTALFLQALSGALEASQAGYSSTATHGSYSGSYFGPSHGQFQGTYSGYTTTYDHSRVAEANARNRALMQSQANANQQNIQYLNAVLLKRTTLVPQQYIAGAVYVERAIHSNYRITVPVENRNFVFNFRLVQD